jgi:hypothetical protein
MKPALVCLLSICLASAGCTSTRSIPLRPAGQSVPRVAVGDRVIVTMKSGAIRHLHVEAIDAQTLTGRNAERSRRGKSSQLLLTDVERIQVRTVRSGPTIGVIAGIVLVGLVARAVYCFSDGRTYCSREDD